MSKSTEKHVNQLGRKPGRGIRPWLLTPKVLAAGAYLGALIATAGIWFMQQYGHLGDAAISQLQLVECLGLMFRFVAVPALLLALIFGGLLLLQHPRVFLKLRWLQVKLIVLLIFIPGAHFFMSSRLEMLRHAAVQGSADPVTENQINVGLVICVLITVFVITLGRLKPRLGQNWAKTYAKLNNPRSSDDTQG